MHTILWVSRHNPTPRQSAALEQAWPSLVIKLDARAFDGAEDIVARFRSSGADDMVVVAPDSVIRAIIRAGIQPIHAVMQPCGRSHPQREVTIESRRGCRYYRFISFERIRSLRYEVEPLVPTARL